MARKPRIHAPAATYHVILRGNARQDIFLDDQDRYRFYEILQKAHERFRFRVHAFCLMTSHIHLEIQVGEIPLSRIMQNIALRYTQWFNWRHKRSGHVFQGRYKAVMVDADEYLLELAAYIHLNPVRARMTAQPEDHRWSSHRAYLGKENLSWLETGFILSQFSTNAGKARTLFADFVGERVKEGRRGGFHGEKTVDSRIFGDDRFVDVVLAEAESLPERKPDVHAVVAAVNKLYGLSDDRLGSRGREREISEARGLAAWATLEISSGKLTELAKLLGRDPSTLTCAVRRIEKRRGIDPSLVDKWDDCGERYWSQVVTSRPHSLSQALGHVVARRHMKQNVNGAVESVSLSGSHNFSKTIQEKITLVAGHGVAGDAHFGRTVKHRSHVAKDPTQPNLRQVHLIHAELHDELEGMGFQVGPGQIGENITTRGISLLQLPAGTKLHLGECAVVQLTGLRNPCAQLDQFQPGLMRAVLERDAEGRLVGKAGVMSIVLQGGDVRSGDQIVVDLPPHPHHRLEKV